MHFADNQHFSGVKTVSKFSEGISIGVILDFLTPFLTLSY